MNKFSEKVDFFKNHRKRIGLLILTSLLIGTVYNGLGIAKDPASPQSKRVKRGEYLVNTAGCHDCHTPWVMKDGGPGPDMPRALSGHPEKIVMPPPPKLEGPWVWIGAGTNTAFAGPWGISYAKNLTPDRTGLGTWTEKEFITAIRTGRDRDTGRPILPPMPWPVYRNLTDEDLKSIFAYLQTISPIENTPPPVQALAAPVAAAP
ncbi:c-type cytochrome [Candidatus Manganitrophus noduliformans]|uniref:C-type cytochrome n=1 Tax=Candidatus Manganitrophus noduliformans TaxID=2606439 RepID=A0A7X6DLA6_9BACT|nr:c-type cytochrome [Candidatus Manganitrophus noduliformans]NKE69269.1 c-type cytochrome [Candidatus Manganitrophus noduliformans]